MRLGLRQEELQQAPAGPPRPEQDALASEDVESHEFLEDLHEQVESAIDLLISHNHTDHVDAVHDLRHLAAPLWRRPSRWKVGEVDDAALYMARAAFWLAVLAASGVLPHAVPQDTARALRLMRVAAKHGLLEAHTALAYRHFTGNHVEQSCETAYQHLQLVAETWLQHAEDNADTAPKPVPLLLRDHQRDRTLAADASVLFSGEQIQLEADLAAQGHGAWQTEVGYRALLGLGVEQDAVRAREAFEAAAGNGEAVALFNLGIIHERGLEVPANATKASEYYARAAQQNVPNSFNGLAALTYEGAGVPRNRSLARLLWERGAELQDPDSTYSLGLLHLDGDEEGGDTPANRTRALELLDSAAALGQWKAPWLLGQVYMEGPSTNCTRALGHLWEFVAQRGDLSEQSASAFEQLVGVPLTAAGHGGEGGRVKVKPLGALLLSAHLAEQGAVAAAMNAGWMLERGQGLPTRGARGTWRVAGVRANAPTVGSLRLAAYYYELAARSNSTVAQVDFANLLLSLDVAYGDDVVVATAEGELRGEARVARALELYRAATEAGDVEAGTSLAWAAVAGVGGAQNLSHAQRLFREAAGRAHGGADGFAPVVGLVVTRSVNGLRWGLPRRVGAGLERWVARRARAGISVPPPSQLLPEPLRKWVRGVPRFVGGGA